MKFKTYKLKDKEINFYAIAKDKNHYFVIATFNNHQIGYCHFCIENGTCKLSRIVVTKKEFLGYGVGNIMFKAMENISYQNNVKYVTAIFIPRVYENSWTITSKFYQNQRMTTFSADYDYCDRDEISKHINSPETKYDLPVILDENFYEKISNFNYVENDLFSSNCNTNSHALQL